MNLNGIIVEWLKDKSEIDLLNPIEGVDYIVAVPNKVYPRSDGQPVVFDGYPNYEWLTKVSAPQPPYDDRFYILQVQNYPSNIPDLTNPLIMGYTQKYEKERRANEQIIASIRQEEQAANNALYLESDYKTMNVLCADYSAVVSEGNTPSQEQVNARLRVADVSSKVLLNAANATALIDAVIAGLTPDITSGWEKDNIVPAYPFQ
jgi:hypothetical protein